MDSNTTTKKKLNPSDYINHADVANCIQQLKARFGNNFENLVVSDTLDDEGHQYVNLVQKGGGVLGVALVGYTYILEQAGIRFLRLAGTSAGAINTSLLAVIGEKKQAKSMKILDYICNLDFFSLVDGHPVARWLIKKIITKKKFEKNLVDIGKIIGGSFLIALLALIALVSLGHWYEWAWSAGKVLFAITGILLLALIVAFVYTWYLYSKLKESGYGINPGHFFYNWIKQVMEENGVSSVSDLNTKAAGIPHLHVRNPDTQNSS
ncbi:MAG TPA: patatin-like phospholipase family protein, partial [Puia sp.]|nr:patatin-like phospholipase family protein [Puia sp.]